MLKGLCLKITILLYVILTSGVKESLCQNIDSIIDQMINNIGNETKTDTVVNVVPFTTFYEQDYRGITEDDVNKYKKKENRLQTRVPSEGFPIFLKKTLRFIYDYYYIFIIILVAIIAYYVAGKGLQFRRASRAAKKLNYLDDEGEDVDIKLSDFEALASKYEDIKEFRVAVRYLYLLLLQKLDARSLIIADDTKKNIDYYYEISDSKIQRGFETALHLYEYIWYGENNIQEQEYQSVSSFYKRLYSTIR
ncbi:MAG: hypothetical protein ACK5IQ_10710 [Bacteroidales bacterium]